VVSGQLPVTTTSLRFFATSDTFTSTHFTNLEEVDAEQEEARRSLLETDGARHRALRRLLQGEFTPQAVSGYETFLRGLTRTTLDNAFAKGEFDLRLIANNDKLLQKGLMHSEHFKRF